MIYDSAVNYCLDRWPDVFTEENTSALDSKVSPLNFLNQLLLLQNSQRIPRKGVLNLI